PPHRRHGQLLRVLPCRRRERRRRLRQLDDQRLRRIPPAAAHPIRGRCADQRRCRAPASIAAAGQSAALQPWGGEVFRTTHPSFRAFSLMFERRGSAVSAAFWGPRTYLRRGSTAQLPASDPQLAKLAGRYVNDSPWLGMAEIVERGGRLWLGTEVPME